MIEGEGIGGQEAAGALAGVGEAASGAARKVAENGVKGDLVGAAATVEGDAAAALTRTVAADQVVVEVEAGVLGIGEGQAARSAGGLGVTGAQAAAVNAAVGAEDGVGDLKLAGVTVDYERAAGGAGDGEAVDARPDGAAEAPLERGDVARQDEDAGAFLGGEHGGVAAGEAEGLARQQVDCAGIDEGADAVAPALGGGGEDGGVENRRGGARPLEAERLPEDDALAVAPRRQKEEIAGLGGVDGVLERVGGGVGGGAHDAHGRGARPDRQGHAERGSRASGAGNAELAGGGADGNGGGDRGVAPPGDFQGGRRSA